MTELSYLNSDLFVFIGVACVPIALGLCIAKFPDVPRGLKFLFAGTIYIALGILIDYWIKTPARPVLDGIFNFQDWDLALALWVYMPSGFVIAFGVFSWFPQLLELQVEIKARVDAELREREQREANERQQNNLQAILDNAPAEIYLKDEEGRYVQINRQFERLFDVKNEDVIGKLPTEIHDPELGKSTREHDLFVLNTGQVEIREEPAVTTMGPRVLHTIKFPIFDNDRKIVGLGAVVSDITDLKNAEKAHAEAEERFRSVFENITVGSIVIDAFGTIRMFNTAAENVFGYSRDELIGSNVSMLMPEPDRSNHTAYLENYRLTGETNVIGTAREVVGLRKSGQTFPMHLGVGEILIEGEKFFIGAASDLSELKNIQSELQMALSEAERANKAKSDFLATMSHEFRTPLNAILGFSEMIRRQYFGKIGDEKYKNYAEDIHDSGKHMLALVNDVLDISAIEAGQRKFEPTLIDLEGLLKHRIRDIENAASDKSIRIDLKILNGPLDLFADERSINQIVLNLLSNAIKFTNDTGTVVVSASSNDDVIEISVSDTGIGIASDQLAKITEPFVQASSSAHLAKEGTGLGLSIVKSLVEEHDGTLKIESKFGKGTTVAFTIPNERQFNQKTTPDDDASAHQPEHA